MKSKRDDLIDRVKMKGMWWGICSRLFGVYILGVVVGFGESSVFGGSVLGLEEEEQVVWWGLVRFLLVLVRTLVDFIVAEWRWCKRAPLLGGMVE